MIHYCVVILGLLALCAAQEEHVMHICEAVDPKIMGTYKASNDKQDGVPVYVNQNEMSFFRSRGYWYLGNLAPWPPETHYRCVELEGCNEGLDFPPSTEEGQWSVAKNFGQEPVPVISKTPCAVVSDEL